MSGTDTIAEPAARQALPCQLDNRLFFAEQAHDIDRAKALCTDCPIRRDCLVGAIERREPWGVWGGEVFVDGVIVAHKRGRGRPRKHPLVAQQTSCRDVTAAA